MAEVLSPLTTSSNDPVSLIHPRSSPSENYQQGMSSSQQPSRLNHSPRSSQYTPQHNGSSGYRNTSTAPIAPYAFKTTPQLRNDVRLSSAPTSPHAQQPLSSENPSAGNRQRYPVSSNSSSSSSSNYPFLPPLSKDDSALFSNFTVPSFSSNFDTNHITLNTGTDGSQSLLDPVKPSPERYRRAHRRTDTGPGSQQGQVESPMEGSTAPVTFGTGKMGQFFYTPQPSFVGVQRPATANATVSTGTTATQQPESISSPDQTRTPSLLNNVDKADLPKRYRRRTSAGNSIDGGVKIPTDSALGVPSPNEPASPIQNNTRQDIRPSSSGSSHRQSSSSPRNELPASSARGLASADTTRRSTNPSPLSKPYAAGEVPSSLNEQSTLNYSHSSNSALSQSPAVAAMAALHVNDKDANKGVKSRIRRAFSFGSAQELKRATGDNSTSNINNSSSAADRAKARQEQFSSELDEEQDAIARQQEAAGLGNSIYSGQGNVFTGSTDNLSISSTASSASLMLRKMGKGMKKGGRSIKGLFRPKSVIGVPAADQSTQASVAQVSMVTVEAEREQVNINVDPHDQAGGGTGFPRLERNSLDVGRMPPPNGVANNEHSDSVSRGPRRSIVGGEQERAEVLAAVKRGILKRSGTSSPVASPIAHPSDGTADHPSPTAYHPSLERRGSPVPSTTSSEPRRTGHRRTDSHTLEGDDYFASVPRVQGNQSTRSLPGTPRGVSRNISFSPRLQFHDVWSSSEYDRRGDIATCNRLTPMLAQQIKEELNTFKMEMEVHELSKPHTHFF